LLRTLATRIPKREQGRGYVEQRHRRQWRVRDHNGRAGQRAIVFFATSRITTSSSVPR
jgi:hypothetical protein